MDAAKQQAFKEQTAALYEALGRFAVEFEHVCFAMRHIVMNILSTQGLNNPRLINIILAELTADPLRGLTAALVAETSRLSTQDERILSKVFADVQMLTQERNDVLHSTWFIGWYGTDAGAFDFAPGVKPKRSKKGDTSLQRTWKIEQFGALTAKASALCDHLRRINACLAGSFKLENNFHFDNAGHLVAQGQPYK